MSTTAAIFQVFRRHINSIFGIFFSLSLSLSYASWQWKESTNVCLFTSKGRVVGRSKCDRNQWTEVQLKLKSIQILCVNYSRKKMLFCVWLSFLDLKLARRQQDFSLFFILIPEQESKTLVWVRTTTVSRSRSRSKSCGHPKPDFTHTHRLNRRKVIKKKSSLDDEIPWQVKLLLLLLRSRDIEKLRRFPWIFFLFSRSLEFPMNEASAAKRLILPLEMKVLGMIQLAQWCMWGQLFRSIIEPMPHKLCLSHSHQTDPKNVLFLNAKRGNVFKCARWPTEANRITGGARLVTAFAAKEKMQSVKHFKQKKKKDVNMWQVSESFNCYSLNSFADAIKANKRQTSSRYFVEFVVLEFLSFFLLTNRLNCRKWLDNHVNVGS